MRQELLIVGLLLAGLGCNSDPRCRRETALLRAEILDLEDKYFLTKAQRDDALAALQGQGKTDIVSKIAKRSPSGSVPENSEIYYGEALYESGVSGDPQSTMIKSDAIDMNQGSVAPYSSEIIYDDLQLPPIQNEAGQPLSRESTPQSPQTPERAGNDSATGDGASNQSILTSPDQQPKTSGSPEALPDPLSGAARGTDGAGRSATNSRLRQANQSTIRNANALPISPVTEVVVERQQTFIRTDEFDTTSLTLLLKPRDASGNARRTSGSLTVSIVDPFSSSPEKPLGIWKFLPEEVELFFTDPNSEPGIQLNLPFEDGLPQGRHVVVMIRLQTPDGRALETTARIPATKSKIKIDQGDDDLLAEGEKAARPAWRPVR